MQDDMYVMDRDDGCTQIIFIIMGYEYDYGNVIGIEITEMIMGYVYDCGDDGGT